MASNLRYYGITKYIIEYIQSLMVLLNQIIPIAKLKTADKLSIMVPTIPLACFHPIIRV